MVLGKSVACHITGGVGWWYMYNNYCRHIYTSHDQIATIGLIVAINSSQMHVYINAWLATMLEIDKISPKSTLAFAAMHQLTN